MTPFRPLNVKPALGRGPSRVGPSPGLPGSQQLLIPTAQMICMALQSLQSIFHKNISESQAPCEETTLRCNVLPHFQSSYYPTKQPRDFGSDLGLSGPSHHKA